MMPRTIRSHLDENGPHAIAEGVRRRGAEVTTTPEANLLGATDPEQLDYCRREGRVIFTYDADMLRLAAGGWPHAGIVDCQQRRRGIGDIVRALVLLWERREPGEVAGRVMYV